MPSYRRDYGPQGCATQDWRDDANCQGTDLAIFFHPDGERGRERQDREAKASRVCRNCPVRAECLNEALTNNYTYGVWGGTTEQQRRRLKKIHSALDPEITAVIPAARLLITAVHNMDAEAAHAILAAHADRMPALCIALAGGNTGDADILSQLAWSTNDGEYLRLREHGVQPSAAAVLAAESTEEALSA